MEQKEVLFGKTLDELKVVVKEMGLPGFSAGQIADWLHKKKAGSIEEMSNLSKKARAQLSERFDMGLIFSSKVQTSADGTKKYLFPAHKNLFVEAAYIPEEDRKTLCVSSQVGCKMGCLFCMTGKQGFQSQLTAGEIINQVRSIEESDLLTNVVYMGMGEPMDNIEEVLKSLQILTSDWGFAWSPRRINVSTIGVVPAMRRFIEESEAHLAISMHSPFDEERKKLMPIQQVYSIEQVIDTLRDYDFGRQRRISFEYIMRSEEHTSELQSRPQLVCRLLLEKEKARGIGAQRARRQFLTHVDHLAHQLEALDPIARAHVAHRLAAPAQVVVVQHVLDQR